ncbi:MAG: MFS transporter [Clostridia bacterium]|nr:MFS transporter [Clostridia bacterium]
MEKEKKNKSNIPLFFLARFAYNVNNRMVYPFISQIAKGVGTSVANVSSAISLKFIISNICPFISSIADKKGRKPVIIGCMFLIMAGLAVFILNPTFLTLVVTMCTGSIGCFAAMSSIQAYVADTETPERAGRIVSVLELGWSTSFIIGMPITSIFILKFGWISPFVVLLILFAALTIWLMVSIKEEPIIKVQEEKKATTLSLLLLVFKDRKAVLVLILHLLIVMPAELVLVTFSTWLEDAFNAQVMSLGMSSFVIGFAELSGEGLSILLSDKFKRLSLVRGGLIVGSVFALLLPLLGSTQIGASLGLFLFFVSTEYIYICCVPLTVQIVPEARAAALGLVGTALAVARAIADLIGPHLMALGLYHVVIPCVVLDIAAFYIIGKIEK